MTSERCRHTSSTHCLWHTRKGTKRRASIFPNQGRRAELQTHLCVECLTKYRQAKAAAISVNMEIFFLNNHLANSAISTSVKRPQNMWPWKLSSPSLLSVWSWLMLAQDKTTRLLYAWIKIISFLQAKMRKRSEGKTEYSLGYLRVLLWTRISVFQDFFLSLSKQRCFCIDKFYLFGFCVDVISKVWVSIAVLPFFLYGQKSWVFSEWKRVVDKVNSACFSSLEITSETAYTFFIEKCGFWKG